MATLDQFSERIEIIANRFEKNTNKLVRQVALLADQTIVLATPVDTGRARSNWIVSVGCTSVNTISPYSEGKALGLAETVNAQGAIAQGVSAVSSRKPGQNIFISNNLSYIGDLNNGTSLQAPKNFVKIAVHAAVAVINKTKLVK